MCVTSLVYAKTTGVTPINLIIRNDYQYFVLKATQIRQV
uniref:Uncharacterized protein n=1 Tax=Rhizophora mucronata TaxID=61149 RepID=A0A2P2MXA5_RHIMU